MVEEETEDGAEEEETESAPLTPRLALTQSANTLILAAEKAEYNNDVTALMKIAGGWMEIHEYLAGVSHEEKKSPLGFTNAHTTTEEEDQEDAIAEEPEARIRSTASKRIRRVY